MTTFRLSVCVIFAVIGCGQPAPPPPPPARTVPAPSAPAKPSALVEARKGFTSKLAKQRPDKTPATPPPPGVFDLVRYESPAGKLSAYLTPDPKDGAKHPAIIWITGGDCNSIDEGCWKDAPPANDQTAAAFRKAGLVMMFPSLRGGNDNPGVKEGFLGEIDDALAARSYLSKQPYVDPKRIYLGGHSTGGTTALLAAECSDQFRAVLSFGPVDEVAGYPREYIPFNTRDRKELQLRSPGRWLAEVKNPTWVVEGTVNGNLSSLQAMAKASKNPNLHFVPVRRADHFSVLGPATKIIADKLVRDDGPECNLTITEAELGKPFTK